MVGNFWPCDRSSQESPRVFLEMPTNKQNVPLGVIAHSAPERIHARTFWCLVCIHDTIESKNDISPEYFNNYSLKSSERSPRLKRIVVVYTHGRISTTDDLDIFRGEPFKKELIGLSIHVLKVCKQYNARAKLFTESSNKANLVNLR